MRFDRSTFAESQLDIASAQRVKQEAKITVRCRHSEMTAEINPPEKMVSQSRPAPGVFIFRSDDNFLSPPTPCIGSRLMLTALYPVSPEPYYEMISGLLPVLD